MTSPNPNSADHIVVVGAGIIGLASSLLLAQDGYRVTVIARDLPGDGGTAWASPWAGAILVPPPNLGNPDLARTSYEWYAATADQDPSSSIQRIHATEYFTDRDNDDSIWYKDIFPQYRTLSTSEIPPQCKIGISYETCVINPEFFLPWLKEKLEGIHVHFIRSELVTLSQALDFVPEARTIVNASGLGSRELASDDSVRGYRGQTMFVKSDWNEVKMIQGSEYTYVIPRVFSGGVILGGISQEDVTDKAVDLSLRRDILRRVNQMTNNAFAHVDVDRDVERDLVGIRPGRLGGIRIERVGRVVHAYGFQGGGYAFSFGAAAKVKDLVNQIHRQPRL